MHFKIFRITKYTSSYAYIIYHTPLVLDRATDKHQLYRHFESGSILRSILQTKINCTSIENSFIFIKEYWFFSLETYSSTKWYTTIGKDYQILFNIRDIIAADFEWCSISEGIRSLFTVKAQDQKYPDTIFTEH